MNQGRSLELRLKSGRHAQPSGPRGFVDLCVEVFDEDTENVEVRDVEAPRVQEGGSPRSGHDGEASQPQVG